MLITVFTRLLASNVWEEAQRLTSKHANASAVAVDMSDREGVSRLVSEADLVVRYAVLFSHNVL